jgi:hypothetical protein
MKAFARRTEFMRRESALSILLSAASLWESRTVLAKSREVLQRLRSPASLSPQRKAARAW